MFEHYFGRGPSPMTRRGFLAGAAGAGATAWLAGCASAPRGAGAAGRVVYVGTYTEAYARGGRREGVFAFRVDPATGAWRPLAATDVGPDPSFLALHPNGRVLYAVNEVEAFGGQPSGAVRAFAAGAEGRLAPLGVPRASRGGAPCYVATDPAGRAVLVANYAGGSVARLPVAPDGGLLDAAQVRQHTGSGPRADRQERAHAHSILPDPSGRFALSADLGTDQLFVYRLGDDATGDALAPAAVPFVATRPGAGPRHLAFHPNGRVLYVANELDLTVGAYRFAPDTGALTPFQVAPAVDGPAGSRTMADLHVAPSGRTLYASVRGANVLVVFAVDPASGALTRVQEIPTGGDWPRNFALDPAGRFLYAANQRSNSVVGFAVDPADGRLTPTGVRVEVPAPACIRFAG